MNQTKTILKVIISLLSAFLISLIGDLGNWYSYVVANGPYQRIYGDSGNYPTITGNIIDLFDLNSKNFNHAVFPFLVLFIALAIYLVLSEKIKKLFWHLWAIIWLLHIIFIVYVAIGLVLPYVYLLTELSDSPLVQKIKIFNIALLVSLSVHVLYLIIQKLKKKKIEQKNRTNSNHSVVE